jgi:hypothetical protein
VEETSLNGVDGDRVESSGDLESFGMKSEMARGGLLFIDSKILAQFVTRTAADSFGIQTEAVVV